MLAQGQLAEDSSNTSTPNSLIYQGWKTDLGTGKTSEPHDD